MGDSLVRMRRQQRGDAIWGVTSLVAIARGAMVACNKPVTVPGQGKSGSTRTLVAKKHVDAVKIIAASLQLATAAQLQSLLTAEVLKEICHV
jgi:hypothetical protein